jgi:hypothetical protein
MMSTPSAEGLVAGSAASSAKRLALTLSASQVDSDRKKLQPLHFGRLRLRLHQRLGAGQRCQCLGKRSRWVNHLFASEAVTVLMACVSALSTSASRVWALMAQARFEPESTGLIDDSPTNTAADTPKASVAPTRTHRPAPFARPAMAVVSSPWLNNLLFTSAFADQ